MTTVNEQNNGYAVVDAGLPGRRPLAGWPSGRRRRPAKAINGVSSVSRVRIPHQPPNLAEYHRYRRLNGKVEEQTMCRTWAIKTLDPFAAGRSVPPPVRTVRERPSDGKAIHRVQLPALHSHLYA